MITSATNLTQVVCNEKDGQSHRLTNQLRRLFDDCNQGIKVTSVVQIIKTSHMLTRLWLDCCQDQLEMLEGLLLWLGKNR